MSNNKKEDTKTGEKETTPVKKTISMIRQKTHVYNNKPFDKIDDDINSWFETKFKEGKNPMLYQKHITEDSVYITTLHTEKIEID